MVVDPEWIELGTSDEKTYYYHSRSDLWINHQQNAQVYGGNLVCLNSEEEYNNVVGLLSNRGNRNVWIGLTDDPSNVAGAYEGNWYWVDGTELSGYDKWGSGEPNNVYNREHVVMMVGDDYRWNDHYETGRPAVIEIRKPTVEIDGVIYVVDAMAGIDLAGYDLTGLDLTGAILTGANLTGANLTNAKLEGADLTGVKSGNIIGNPTLDSNYSLVSGYIIGPGVDLTDVDLTGANLTGADLTNSISLNTNLSNANLTDAKLISLKASDGYDILQIETIFGTGQDVSLQYGGDTLSSTTETTALWDGEFKLQTSGSDIIKYQNNDSIELKAPILTPYSAFENDLQMHMNDFEYLLSDFTILKSNLENNFDSYLDLFKNRIEAQMNTGHLVHYSLDQILPGTIGIDENFINCLLDGTSSFENSIMSYLLSSMRPVTLGAFSPYSSLYTDRSSFRILRPDGKTFTLNNFDVDLNSLSGISTNIAGDFISKFACIRTGVNGVEHEYKLNNYDSSNTYSSIEEFLAENGINIQYVDFQIKEYLNKDAVYNEAINIKIDEVVQYCSTVLSSTFLNDIVTALNNYIQGYENYLSEMRNATDERDHWLQQRDNIQLEIDNVSQMTASEQEAYAADAGQSSYSEWLEYQEIAAFQYYDLALYNSYYIEENAHYELEVDKNTLETFWDDASARMIQNYSEYEMMRIWGIHDKVMYWDMDSYYSNYYAKLLGVDVNSSDYIVTLTNADLTGADLTGADLRSTDLTGADLTNVKSGNIIGNPTLDTNYSIVSGYIIGPSVDLTGADLKEVDLTNTNLSNVTLTDADLRLANLSGANMTNVTIGESTTPLPPLQFIKRDLRNRSIQNVKISSLENSIIDSTTNFAGADLTNVDFSKAIFKGSSGDRQKAMDSGWTDEELTAIGWTA